MKIFNLRTLPLQDFFLLVGIVVSLIFQGIFWVWTIYYYDVLLLDPIYKPITKDYLYWYIENDITRPNGVELVTLTDKFPIIFGLLFITIIFYILMRKKCRIMLGIRRIIIAFAIYGLVCALASYYIRYIAPHYRLYMRLVSTELTSILLLYFIFYMTYISIKEQKCDGKSSDRLSQENAGGD